MVPKLCTLKYHFPHIGVYIFKKEQWEDEQKTNENRYLKENERNRGKGTEMENSSDCTLFL